MRNIFFGLTFWSLYTLGFTVALPVFLYYTTEGFGEPPQESATVAFTYLGLGIVIWVSAIILYTRFFIKAVFTDKKQLEKTAQEGIEITAKIISKKQTGVFRDMAILDLELAFNNLVGTPVQIPYQLNDGKAFENRFEVGNTIQMRANLNGKQATFVPKQMQVVRNSGITILYVLIFVFLLLAAFAYPIFSYWLESNGSGWRFLKISHPWIMVPLINLGVGFIIWLIARTIGKANSNPAEPLRMVLYGLKVNAQILSYRQTGMYINEQPQVAFELEYTDQQGIKQSFVYKKIISLLEIHKLDKGNVDIMYLPNEPQNIVFYEDLSL